MLSRIRDRNIWLIDGAIFLLGLAYGIAISLLAHFLTNERHFTKENIGSLAAWFALGIISLSLPMGAFIRRFSARVTLITSLVGYAVTVTVFPFLTTFTEAAAVRFLDGAFSVGVWVSCETILLSRSGEDNKAFITSLYAVAMALGYVVGSVTAKAIMVVFPGRYAYAFVTSGAIAAIASALIALRLDADRLVSRGSHPHPQPPLPEGRGGSEERAGLASSPLSLQGEGVGGEGRSTSSPLSLQGEGVGGEGRSATATLFWRIKSSCFATFAYGYFQASVVLFLPLYLVEKKGITENQTIIIPAFFAGGMLLFSNVAGRLGDRYGHLFVMRILGALGTLMIIGFVFLDHYTLMCVAVFIAGATLASISPVSLALQGVITDPRDYSRSNAIYNVFYAAGMLLGPLISGSISDRVGGTAMLYHLAALWTAFVVFTIAFARDDPAARGRRSRARNPAKA